LPTGWSWPVRTAGGRCRLSSAGLDLLRAIMTVRFTTPDQDDYLDTSSGIVVAREQAGLKVRQFGVGKIRLLETTTGAL